MSKHVHVFFCKAYSSWSIPTLPPPQVPTPLRTKRPQRSADTASRTHAHTPMTHREHTIHEPNKTKQTDIKRTPPQLIVLVPSPADNGAVPQINVPAASCTTRVQGAAIVRGRLGEPCDDASPVICVERFTENSIFFIAHLIIAHLLALAAFVV